MAQAALPYPDSHDHQALPRPGIAGRGTHSRPNSNERKGLCQCSSCPLSPGIALLPKAHGCRLSTHLTVSRARLRKVGQAHDQPPHSQLAWASHMRNAPSPHFPWCCRRRGLREPCHAAVRTWEYVRARRGRGFSSLRSARTRRRRLQREMSLRRPITNLAGNLDRNPLLVPGLRLSHRRRPLPGLVARPWLAVLRRSHALLDGQNGTPPPLVNRPPTSPAVSMVWHSFRRTPGVAGGARLSTSPGTTAVKQGH